MAKIVMRYFMGQYSSQLLIVCLLEKTRRHVKLTAAGICGIDAGILNNAHTCLF